MRYEKLLRNIVLHSSSIVFRLNLSRCTKFTNIDKTMSTDVEFLAESRIILKDVFHAGVEAVAPETLIRNKVKLENGLLHVLDQTFELKENVYLVGFGKAVMGMAIVLDYILGDLLKKGIVSVPFKSKESLWNFKKGSAFPKLISAIEYYEGAQNNQPDDICFEATHKIIDLVEPLTENDTLIVLVSGGGSALLYMPSPILDYEDKLNLCKSLQNAGATIKELNIVRRKLSMVKGGGLARMAYPASVITLILSDVVGNPIDVIASGPTVYNSKAPELVTSVLRKYNLFKTVEGDLKRVLTSKDTFDDTPLLNSTKQFKHVNNIILGSNAVAIEAASNESKKKRVTPIILRNDVTGDVHAVSLAYAHVTSLICLALDKSLEKKEFFEKVIDNPILPLPRSKVDEIYNLLEDIGGEGLILIGGGEPTVVVRGEGKGGRNQELALHFSLDWLAKIKCFPQLSEYDVIMLSAGTDGQDGPTDATGAFGYPAIAPIVHQLYKKVENDLKVSKTKVVEAKAKRDAPVEAEEKDSEEGKMQQLSDFLMLEYKKAQTQSEKVPIKDFKDEDDLQVVYPLILQTMEVERMLPENALMENDTYNFYSRFKKGLDLLKTGLTGTNVMDLHLIYIKKRKCGCKIDYMEGYKTESIMDMHDLHIDPKTIDKYEKMMRAGFNWDDFWCKKFVAEDKVDQINLTITDDNFVDPCCRKNRKFPTK